MSVRCTSSTPSANTCSTNNRLFQVLHAGVTDTKAPKSKDDGSNMVPKGASNWESLSVVELSSRIKADYKRHINQDMWALIQKNPDEKRVIHADSGANLHAVITITKEALNIDVRSSLEIPRFNSGTAVKQAVGMAILLPLKDVFGLIDTVIDSALTKFKDAQTPN